MTCNYFEYKEITDKLFYGVALTDGHMDSATEKIRQYIINGSAGYIMEQLGVGLKVVTRKDFLGEEKMIRKRFIFLKGERKGEELNIDEIRAIGMFLKYGAFYKFYKEKK